MLGVACALVVQICLSLGWLDGLERGTLDALFRMRGGRMGVVGSLFVVAGFLMLGSLGVVFGSLRVVGGGLLVAVCCFLRHGCGNLSEHPRWHLAFVRARWRRVTKKPAFYTSLYLHYQHITYKYGILARLALWHKIVGWANAFGCSLKIEPAGFVPQL